jgi:hypothetical protein
LKKLAFVAGAGLLATSALLVGRTSNAADHLDAPAAASNPMADLADVYTWMSADGKLNLAMTVSPADDNTRQFGPSVQYVFHVSEYAGADNMSAFGTPPTEHKIICTFTSSSKGSCWVTTGTTVNDYVTGDPSATTGITSADGKIKFFAGQRSDPFFFNLSGFLTAQSTVEGAAAGLTFDAAGCPQIDAATGNVLRTQLTATPAAMVGPCPAGVKDCFASYNVKAIVLQLDKSVVLATGNHLLSVWGSTHMGS